VTVNIQDTVGTADVPDRSTFTRWAMAALESAADVEVTVRIVDEDEMTALNRDYRGRNQPTNVLSFQFDDPPGVRTNILGDIVVCAPVVMREAAAQQKSAEAYWAHMVVHGVLHLRGFDHENDRDAAVMEATEIRVLDRLGFPSPYNDD
jgi:probable rRNA maturation factor